jgi:hypothetical protein
MSADAFWAKDRYSVFDRPVGCNFAEGHRCFLLIRHTWRLSHVVVLTRRMFSLLAGRVSQIEFAWAGSHYASVLARGLSFHSYDGLHLSDE